MVRGGNEPPIGGNRDDRLGYPSLNGEGRGDGILLTAAGLFRELLDHGRGGPSASEVF